MEVEGEEARDGNEEKVIAVEEVIVLDEGTRGGRRMGCSRGKGSARCGLRGVNGDALRGICCKPNFFEC